MSRRYLTDLIGRYLGLGGATADSSNPLSVRGVGALFDGNTTGHQVRINKASAGQTASFLFQTGYSGRAEFGTLGNDNYTVKVSFDGASWNDAFEVAAATGVTDFKQQPTVLGQTIFHAGNDGTGSGLDADLLDGQEGSFYRSASNLNAGSLPNARLANMTQATIKGRAAGAGTGVPVDLTAAQLVSIINTADGTGTGLDADLLDGNEASAFAFLTGATFTGDVVAPNLVRTNANNNIGTSLFEAHYGIQGGYGDGNGSGSTWGAPIWSMGDAYIGSSTGVDYVPGTYGMSWLRTSNPSANADVGEGVYVNRNGTLVAAFGLVGGYIAGKLKVVGDSILGNVGIGGATPDATNRLSVNTPAVLLNNAGAGIDMKFNKNAAANDAALTFQQGFTTQALMGLLGDNNFTLKVGPSLLTAMSVNRLTGAVSFPNTTITATPAGVDDEVQYRNGSALGAAGLVRIGASGNLNLVSNSGQPSPPSADRLQIYARRRAGADWLEVQRPNGREFPLGPHMGLNRVAWWAPNSGTSVAVQGMPRTAVGTTATPALAATNLSTSIRRWRVTSATTANSASDERSAATVCWRGNAAGRGGFTYTNRISLLTLQPDASAYFGLLAQTSAMSTSQAITALVNCIGFGFTNGVDTNWQLIHNSSSGTPTQVDLGANFPVNNTVNVYTIIIYAEPNGSSVFARIVNETDGSVFEHEITTNLPTNTTFLSVRNYMNNGGAAAAVAYECSGVYLETDY
ncbi:hypothetical protein RCCWILLIS_17 [Rhodobacter phage RcCWillis]|nr:hypothetical protein RCCWILLIS_17 [Rhodobacter phage RcCWillis]